MAEFDSKASRGVRAANRLTAAMVRNASDPGKYHDGGGLGLFLRVESNGTRFWVQRITIAGRRRELGLGSPPVVTLAMVRDAAMDNKRLIRAGGDPLANKRKVRATAVAAIRSNGWAATLCISNACPSAQPEASSPIG